MFRRFIFSALATLVAGGPAVTPTAVRPRYTSDGALRRPPEIERWILVGVSLGLGYRDATAGGLGMFHRVYLEPGAYDHYVRTGRFQPGTMLALSLHQPSRRVPPSRAGWSEGPFVSLQLAVKDPTRFPGGWAYFDCGRDAATATALSAERCQACHAEHGASDNVFVQFYPTLRDLPSGVSRGFPAP
jgi:hypothetical protein